ncbi:MAG: crotonase/enoyl-CoA hydratase family protein [Acidimicrobiales bacterium]
MTDALPRYHLDGTTAVITRDDGKANAFSSAVVARLEELTSQAEADGARALVLVGRPGRFSAGFDLAEMTAGVEAMRELVKAGARWWARLYLLGVPTIAASTGHALAGGAITLLACDVRLGADVPCKVGLTEVAIGMTMPKFVVELARERLAPSALPLATIGAQAFDAAGAAAAGYLDRVVPEDELLAEAMAEAARLGELSPAAFGATKRNLRGEVVARILAELDADMATVGMPDL